MRQRSILRVVALEVAWWLIMLLIAGSVMLFCSMIGAVVGMYIVEKAEVHNVDTIHGVSIKRYDVKPSRTR